MTNFISRAFQARTSERCGECKSERGSITAFTCVFILALLALAGLVIDSGLTFSARQRALTEASQAARLGASTLSTNALYADQVAVDPQAAVAAAEGFMAQAGHRGTAWISGDRLYARVDYERPTVLLDLVGINQMAVNETASAVDVRGIVTQEGP